MFGLLHHTWRLFEADPTLTGIVVVAFVVLAVAYLVHRIRRGGSSR